MAGFNVSICMAVTLLSVLVTTTPTTATTTTTTKPTTSPTCTNDYLVSHCHNKDMVYGVCKFYRDIAECYEEFKKNCSTENDFETGRFEEILASLHARSEVCPGARMCFKEELRICEEKAPYYMEYQIEHSEKGKETYCKQYLGKVPDAKSCIEDLTGKCVKKYHYKFANDSVHHLNYVVNLCDGYE